MKKPTIQLNKKYKDSPKFKNLNKNVNDLLKNGYFTTK